MFYYPLKRIGLAFLMAYAVTAFLPFIYQGILWVWRTTLPPLTDFILLLTVSTITTIKIRFHILRNVILDSFIPGFVLSLLSYLIYVGFFAYLTCGFFEYPLSEMFAGGAVLGLIANAYFLRKY